MTETEIESFMQAFFALPEADQRRIITMNMQAEGAIMQLRDDAQAMALVKKFRLSVTGHANMGSSLWEAKDERSLIYAQSSDPNRAIVECVAKMQAARTRVTTE